MEQVSIAITKTFFFNSMIIDFVDTYSHICRWSLTQKSFWTQIISPSLPHVCERSSHASPTPTVRIWMSLSSPTKKKTPNCIFDILDGDSCLTIAFHIDQHCSGYLNRRSNIIRCKPPSLSLVTVFKKPLDLLTRGRLLSAVNCTLCINFWWWFFMTM